jgi:predicted negative regulator of RcsB-dependent stress response
VTKLAVEWIALLALLFAAGVIGYAWRGERNQDAISTAQGNEQVCQSALKGNAAKLAEIKGHLADLKKRHDDMLAAADKTLAARDAEIKRLTDAAKARTTSIRNTAHDDPDCAPLARLAVCPAVAGQLWPAAAEGAAADRHAH